jgi:hypothetical protein
MFLFKQQNLMLCLKIYSLRRITRKVFAKTINSSENIAASGSNSKMFMKNLKLPLKLN